MALYGEFRALPFGGCLRDLISRVMFFAPFHLAICEIKLSETLRMVSANAFHQVHGCGIPSCC